MLIHKLSRPKLSKPNASAPHKTNLTLTTTHLPNLTYVPPVTHPSIQVQHRFRVHSTVPNIMCNTRAVCVVFVRFARLVRRRVDFVCLRRQRSFLGGGLLFFFALCCRLSLSLSPSPPFFFLSLGFLSNGLRWYLCAVVR
jgi:hypothetical protein